MLQTLLDQGLGAGRYQVINAGVPGYTSLQGVTYLRDDGLALHPAIVIAGYGFNDPAWNGDLEVQIANNARWMALLRADDFLLDTSTLYRWMRWQGRGTGETVRSAQVPLDKYTSNMTALIALTREHDAHLLLLRFSQPGPLQTRYRNRLAEIAAAQQVPLLTYGGPRFDLVHPTPQGYRQFAEQIFTCLRDEGYVE